MKVLVKVDNNTIEFINRKDEKKDYKNMLDTNIISHDELVFSDEYIKGNNKILTSFFSELVKTYNIDTAIFQNMDVANLIAPILVKIKKIVNVKFDSDEILPYKMSEIICKYPDIKYISAEYIPPYMFEMLDKYNIIPESRNEILFTSNFMELNGLRNYSSIYYKFTLYMEFPLSKDDLRDFKTFLKINKNLKLIRIKAANKFNLEEIINLLNEYKYKNVKIMLYGDKFDNALVDFLQKNAKKIQKKYKIKVSIKYSEKFIEENIAKETNNLFLRYTALLLLFMALFSIGLIFYDNYKSMKKVTKIQNELQSLIIATDPEELKDKINETENENAKKVVNPYITALSSINPDVVSWLTVKNTNIDYAILQTNNNDYYLNYNIYNEKDPNGWLFLDYENSSVDIDDNIIIYGHNRFVNGVMFGTLNKLLYKDFYDDDENLIIEYDTAFGSYKYKIFSVYIIATTNDYLQTNFISKDEKLTFLKTISERSNHKFDTVLDENTKVLTLSTCQSDTTRLVVHAALIEE